MKTLANFFRNCSAVLLAVLLSICCLQSDGSTYVSFEPLQNGFAAEAQAKTTHEKKSQSVKKSSSELSAERAFRKLTAPDFDLSEIFPYSKNLYIPVNGNVPFFKPEECTNRSFEYYSPLDRLGRCGPVCASVGVDLMPDTPRGSIAAIKPTGWHLVKYDCVNGKYLYNRCHLLGYQLTGESSNERNLITGTRALNVEAMLPFENMTADYVKETRHHVMYRVTPYFKGDNLLASGVLMEGWSVEDHGESICFNVFCYNVQPGIDIDYADGSSRLSEEVSQSKTLSADTGQSDVFILNTRTGVFHRTTCVRVKRISSSRRRKITAGREKLLLNGYKPCKVCNP
jgi:DNA-entry nuclease